MNNHKVLYFSIVCAIGAIAFSHAAHSTASNKGIAAPNTISGLQAGLWEITRESSGGPMGKKNEQLEICYSEEVLAASPGLPFLFSPSGKNKSNAEDKDRAAPECVMADMKQANGKATFTTICKTPRGDVRGKWQGDYSADSFKMNGTMKVAFFSIKAKTQGRYLGPCSTSE
jgi:hypothetical protein